MFYDSFDLMILAQLNYAVSRSNVYFWQYSTDHWKLLHKQQTGEDAFNITSGFSKFRQFPVHVFTLL